MARSPFIIRLPDEPGALLGAAGIIREYEGNISRIHYDRSIDPRTVFLEVEAGEEEHDRISDSLAARGFLQTTLAGAGMLRFHLHLPNEPGALHGFLTRLAPSRANITAIDFDEKGSDPDRVSLTLTLEEPGATAALLDELKARYRIEILEYDPSGSRLDDTVFYVRFAQELREIIGGGEDPFLLRLLHDVNHIVQELHRRGQDPRQVFSSVLATGRTLRETAGPGFSADYQHIEVTERVVLHCFQLPCGGNLFLLQEPGGCIMIDTGYGIYHDDILGMLDHYGIDVEGTLWKIYLTHGDADHCGGAGFFPVPSVMSRKTQEILRENNRAYGSSSQRSVLEPVYTTLINLFSRFTPPSDVVLLSDATDQREGEFPQPDAPGGGFPYLDRFTFGGLAFEVRESLGGHLAGQVFLVSREGGLLFTADSLINFDSLTEDRKRYSTLAVDLITSVNVDSALAREERRILLALAADMDIALAPAGRRCLVCGGHGAVSVRDGDRLVAREPVEHYYPG